MPSVSLRATQMPASPIRKLVPFADAAKARGIEVLHLNIGQPDIEAPPQFWTAITENHPRVLEYSHSAGNASLRKRAREEYAKIGISLKENELMVTTAGSEALVFAMMATMNPGDEVIVPEPMYANYISFAMLAGVHVVPITTSIDDGFALPSAEAFAAKISPKTRGILICNPNNPTGTVYSAAQLESLRQIALKHDLFIFADEVYREFNYTGKPVPSVMQLEGLENHAIMIDSVSKRFSLCGARLGFLVSRNAAVMDAALRMGQARLSPPGLAQIGVEAAMDAPPEYFEGVRDEYIRRRDAVTQGVNQIEGAFCPTIDGAFYATVRLPIDDSDRFCEWLLSDFSEDGATIMLAPATGFYATEGLGKNEVRIAYVLEVPKLERAIRILRSALEKYPGRTN